MDSLKEKLIALQVPSEEAENITKFIHQYLQKNSPEKCWQQLITEFFSKPASSKPHISSTTYTNPTADNSIDNPIDNPKLLKSPKLSFSTYPFAAQLLLYKTLYPHWQTLPAQAWMPNDQSTHTSNIWKLMQAKGFKDYNQLHKWSIQQYPEFWEYMVKQLGIIFDRPYTQIVNLDKGVESPQWFEQSTLNIINSCFKADPQSIAIICQTELSSNKNLERDIKQSAENIKVTKTTYQDLNLLSNRIANGIKKHFKPGDNIAIIMTMNTEAVAIYLGIIKAGCAVVSIADSFSSEEIAIRLKISETKAVFTQEYYIREGKTIVLYDRIQEANAPTTIVLSEKPSVAMLRPQDLSWQDFLSNNDQFEPVSRSPSAHINILFSSGTTGDPKAIPWNHTTPIKCSSDAYLHQNVQAGDIFCWPTNLGWMMGPWLIFATLINNATMALYQGVPNGKGFGQFIQDHKITHLGVVPTLVKTWRNSACMEALDWSHIKLFSSTGECSNVEDMLYLMALVQYRPIIEYCGGTEIGGAYVTGTVVQPAAPAAFITSTLGLDFVILDEQGQLSNKGEVALIPPSIGLSTELLNKDHHQVYYQDMPQLNSKVLRRHGDEIERYSNGFYRLHGRIDDTMNLSGIKISSAEIERSLNLHPKILETAAIAVEPAGGGPSQLIIYAVLKSQKEMMGVIDPVLFKKELQNIIKQHLNPLFKIEQVICLPALPRTASNKVMRRVLREEYEIHH